MSDRARDLSRGTAFNAASRVLSAAVAIGLSPLIIAHIGLSDFGFWSLVSSAASYALVLDFGIGVTLARHFAENQASGDAARTRKQAASGLAISALVTVATLALTLAIVVVIEASGIADGWPSGWAIGVLGSTVALGGTLMASPYLAFPRAEQLWGLSSAPVVAYQAVYAALSVVLLLAGLGMAGLGVAMGLGGIAMFLTARTFQRKHWPGGIELRAATREESVALVRYGGNLQVAGLAQLVNTQADKPLILAAGGSLAFVGAYDLASRVILQVRALPLGAVFPLVVSLTKSTTENLGDAIPAYRWSYEKLAVLGVGPLFAVYGIAFAAIPVWLGSGYDDVGLVLVVLGLGYGLNLLTAAGTAMANARGRPQLERNYCLIMLACKALLSLILGVAFGPWGVVAATPLALSLSSAWFLTRLRSLLQTEAGGAVPVGHLGGRVLEALALGMLIGALGVAGGVALKTVGAPIWEFAAFCAAALLALCGTWLVAFKETRQAVNSLGRRRPGASA